MATAPVAAAERAPLSTTTRVALSQVKPTIGVSASRTSVGAEGRLEPVRVTRVPPASGPLDGVVAVTTGD